MIYLIKLAYKLVKKKKVNASSAYQEHSNK